MVEYRRTTLTKKYAKFYWSTECQKAFEYLKDSLTVVPLLACPDTSKPYILYCDAGDTAIGSVLCQPCEENEQNIYGVKSNEKPIYFLSHKLSKTQRKWPIIEKECFAIFYSLTKLDHYLNGAEFIIKTDHKPLKYLLESPMQNKRVQMWALSIAGYNCKIEYIPGSENTVADLLSRTPQNDVNVELNDKSEVEVEISDKTFEIDALNSNRFSPKQYVNYKLPADKDTFNEIPQTFEDFDMKKEQNLDKNIVDIMDKLRNKSESKTINSKFMIINDLLYYISNADDEPITRLYIPKQLRNPVMYQYHELLGHFGIQKCFSNIKQKYFWENLYKDLYEYISKCQICQMRSAKKIKPPMQETDIPKFCFSKIGLDLSGPYPTTLSGNRYIVIFSCLYSGWIEAFAVKNKESINIAHLLIDEIFPRHSCPLAILTDNGSENTSRIVKEVLDILNLHHVTTSFYHPQSNAKVERFHRTLHDVLSKKIQDNMQTWDLYLNQTLAAIRFNINESTKFSPFYLLYGRDPILPLDNILKPRRKYYGDQEHQIALQEQHKAFTMVYKNLKKAKKRQAKYADKNAKEVKFEVGDPVYLKQHRKQNKLQANWQPYYRIIEKTGPVSFIVKNQLNGSTTKTHAEHLLPAKIDDWEMPKNQFDRPMRATQFVISPEQTESENSSENESENEPLIKIAKRFRRERTDLSNSETDMPNMELNAKLKHKHFMEQEMSDIFDKTTENNNSSCNEYEQSTEEDMLIDEVKIRRKKKTKTKSSKDLLALQSHNKK